METTYYIAISKIMDMFSNTELYTEMLEKPGQKNHAENQEIVTQTSSTLTDKVKYFVTEFK